MICERIIGESDQCRRDQKTAWTHLSGKYLGIVKVLMCNLGWSSHHDA